MLLWLLWLLYIMNYNHITDSILCHIEISLAKKFIQLLFLFCLRQISRAWAEGSLIIS